MVPRGRPLISVDYKYNMQKDIYFIVTDNKGSLQEGLLYLSKYPDHFSNVFIRSVYLPLFMYKLFGYFNEVDSHNKSRKYDLGLEKFWVTQCGWLRLCTTVSMVMTITNLRKPFSYGVKIDHYENFIDIQEFSERLSLDCFNNTFQMMLGSQKRTYNPLFMYKFFGYVNEV